MIQELIQTLTPEEKETLQKKVTDSKTNLHKFIKAVIDDPEVSKEELQKRFEINENTYFKNLSLAKDEIYEVIKGHMKNAYDDLLLSNLLYRRGLDVQASKLRLRLESEYDRQGWWSVLNELYSFDMMVAYTKCDIPRMEKIRDKAIKNIDRLHSFVNVDREVIVQMAIIEKGDLNEKDFPDYERKLAELLAEAQKTGHHIPIFNALYSLYIFHTKYLISREKAAKIVREMEAFLIKYENSLIPYTRSAALLSIVAFYAIFENVERNVVFEEKAELAPGSHGLLYDAQLILVYASYYFLKKDQANFSMYCERFMSLPMDRTFAYKKAYFSALDAYMKGDSQMFHHYQNEFHQMDDSREYDEYNLTLRYLEELFLIKEKNYSLSQDKLEALTKFMKRNMSKSRAGMEKVNIDMLRSAIKGTKLIAPGSPIYRVTTFIYSELAVVNK